MIYLSIYMNIRLQNKLKIDKSFIQIKKNLLKKQSKINIFHIKKLLKEKDILSHLWRDRI